MLSSILLSTLAVALLASQADARACTAPPKNAKALYIITNDAKGNGIISLPIGADGMIGNGTCTSTGGMGASSFNAMGVAGPDSLASQAPLTVVGDKLFSVNPGSNTLSMFAIDKANPTKLVMLGTPAPVPGEFLMSVTASKKNNMVCVAASGAKAGVSCASFTAQGLGAMDALRPFELGQTTPPLGPLNTVSQVLFSHDGSQLFAMVKGDPMTNKTGFISTFAAQNGKVSQEGVRSTPNGTAVLFGSALVPGSRDTVFVTDASFGAAVLKVDRTGKAMTQGLGKIEGQKATCWATVSPATKSAWVTDVLANRLVEMSLTDAKVIGQPIDLTKSNSDPGLLDLAAAGNLVYALSPGNGTTNAAVTVVDVVARKQVQHFDLKSLGGSKSSAGLVLMM